MASWDWTIDLMKKGLRPRKAAHVDTTAGLNDWPDEEGIKTLSS